MQCVTPTSARYHMRYHTCYHTFSFSLAWIGHNAMRYHNFNMLPHALPYIFSQISMVWSYLQRVTTCYRQIFKKNYFLKKIDGDANSPKPGKSQRKYTVTCVVTRASYVNAFHYGISMFAEFEKLPCPSVISISARLYNPSHLLLWNLLNI